jgi:hypothetical protein
MFDRNVRSAWRMIIGCALLFLCLCAKAQEYVNLTAQQVRIDSLLPVYTYQKQLGSHYADSVWHVSIDYPLFIDMSEEDVARLRQLGQEALPSLPEVSQTVGVVRRQGVLEVSLVPLVYRDGKYQKLVSFKLNVTSTPVAKTRADAVTNGARYADHSVLREGTWAKISVPATGFYELTDALIKKAGFADPAKVKLYGYGGALQPERLTADYLAESDDLTEVATCEVDGRRVFYGIGPVNWASATTTERTRNPYSQYGCYFLTESDDAPLSISLDELTAAHYPTANDYHDLYEVDNFAW